MIDTNCYLRKRKDLSQLSKLEDQIVHLITDIYYSDPLLLTSEMEKEDSLPLILYFNLLRQLLYNLASDPFPQQIVTFTFKQLESGLTASNINYSAKIRTLEDSFFITPTMKYEPNFEFERILIWGGLYVMIRHDFSQEKSDKICQTMLTCVMNNPYKEDYFDPFLREILQEKVPETSTNPTPPDGDQVESQVENRVEQQVEKKVEKKVDSRVKKQVEPTTEEKLAACFTLDGLLHQATHYFYDQPAFIETLKTLLRQTVNKQSGGDPHVQNLLQAKLKIVSTKVKNKNQEQTHHATADFHHLILHPSPKKLLRRLHQLIDGKSGAAVGAVLLRAQQKGYLSKVPTRAQFESEFTLNGGWNAIQNYMNDNSEKALAKANTIIIFKGE